MLKLVAMASLGLIACSAEHASQGPATGRRSTPEKITFSWIKNEIMGAPTARCLECHSGPQAKEGIRFEELDQVIRDGLIVPGKPEESPLYLELASGSMPPKPPRPSAEDIELIRRWIADGAAGMESLSLSPRVHSTCSWEKPECPQGMHCKLSWCLECEFRCEPDS